MAKKKEEFTPVFDGHIKLTAQIDGKDYDAVSTRVMYQMNAIPFGEVNLAVGTNTTTLKPSLVHKNFQTFKEGMPIKLVLEIESTHKSSKVPNGKFDLFEGYLAGTPGTVRSINGTATVNCGILHWLRDLDFTSVMSRSFVPDAIDTMGHQAVFFATDTNARTPVSAIPGINDILIDFQKDVWLTLKEILVRLANGVVRLDQLDPVGIQNGEALKALNRINDPADKSLTQGKLALDDRFADDKLLIALRGEMGERVFGTIGGGTAWNKILQAANAFHFAVIPTVKSATLAPHIFSTKQSFIAITADEAYHVEVQPYMHREMSALCLIGEGTNDFDARDKAVYQRTIIGVSSNVQGKFRGSIDFKRAPSWLCNAKIGVGQIFTQDWVAQSVANSMAVPKADVPAGVQNQTLVNLSKALAISGNALAEYYLIDERFKMRQGILLGRLRFDIAPGTAVDLVNMMPQLVDGQDDRFFANVYGVEYSIDAAAPGASTALYLNAIVTQEQARNPRNTLEKHPMYKDKWNGTKLLAEK